MSRPVSLVARPARIARAKWVVVLETYLDLSRCAQPSGRPLATGALEDRHTIALAGYIGQTESWECFDPKWIARLRQDGLSTFHTTDILAGAPPFEGWDPVRAAPLIADLIDIVNAHVTLGIGCVAPVENADERPTPYLVCLHQCLEIVLTHPAVARVEPIAVCLDWEDAVRGKSEEYVAKLKQVSPQAENHWRRFTALTFVYQPDAITEDGFVGIPALQAADLLAHVHMVYQHQHRPPYISTGEIEGVPFESWSLDRTLFDLYAQRVRSGGFAIL